MEKEKKKIEREIKLYSCLEFLFSKVVSMGSIGLFCISFFSSFGTNSLNIISLISLCVSPPIFVTSIWLGVKQANNKKIAQSKLQKLLSEKIPSKENSRKMMYENLTKKKEILKSYQNSRERKVNVTLLTTYQQEENISLKLRKK